jgi:post-segregation antitoxin (ccd killing protein)
MVRTQIQLTEEQMMRLRQASAERGVSIAALIREAIDRALEMNERNRRWERALSVVGKYRDVDGATDVSARTDDYAAEAFEHWRR